MPMLFIFALISVIGMLVNSLFSQSTIGGVIFFLLYFLIVGYWSSVLIERVFSIHSALLRYVFGILLVFSLISSVGGIFIVLYKFTLPILFGIIIVTGAGIFGIYKRFFEQGDDTALISEIHFFFKNTRERIARLGDASVRSYKVPVAIGGVLLILIALWAYVGNGGSDVHIRTPFEVIPDQFVWVFGMLTALFLGLLFFRPGPALLGVVILFSLAQHAYIPAVYRLPYGLDDWRHVGMMERIVSNGFIAPYVITPHTDWSSVGPIRIPTALISGPKLSYASFWAAGILLHTVLAIDLVPLTVWWQYLFFSFFTPILFYLIANKIFVRKKRSDSRNDRIPLLAAFLPALFYPMQLYGAVSLPVGFGFVSFLVFIFTVISWKEKRNKALLWLVILEFFLMFFNYIIYWLMGALILGFILVYQKTRPYHHSMGKKAVRIGYLIISLLFIPIVSLWGSPNARFDILTTDFSYFKDFWVHTLQYLPGFKPIGSPRPQAGNLIWHDMQSSFVDLVPFNFPYFDTLLLVGVVVLFVLGLKELLKKESFNRTLIFYSFVVSIGSIFLDRYYFGGIHLLTERMDLIVDFALVFVLVFGIQQLLSWITLHEGSRLLVFGIALPSAARSRRSLGKFVLILFLTFTVISTMISGPVYGRATRGHFEAARFMVRDMEQNNRDYCVLTEEFAVAALEAASRGTIINGNFPIEYGYLEERGNIFIDMFSNPQIRWMEQATKISARAGCYLVVDKRFLADWNKTQIGWILGGPVYRVDDVHIWRYDK